MRIRPHLLLRLGLVLATLPALVVPAHAADAAGESSPALAQATYMTLIRQLRERNPALADKLRAIEGQSGGGFGGGRGAAPEGPETLASVVGARRPSVTTALGQLMGRNLIERRPDGGWLLHGDPPEPRTRPAREAASLAHFTRSA